MEEQSERKVSYHNDLMDLEEKDRNIVIKALLKTIADAYDVEGLDRIRHEQTHLLQELKKSGIIYYEYENDE